MKLLEQHISENLKRTASIYIPMKDGKTLNKREGGEWLFVGKSESGTHYSCKFDNVLEAQKYCEEWVSKDD